MWHNSGMDTPEKHTVEKRGQMLGPGTISKTLRPYIVALRSRIPDRWMRDYVYGPLSGQARRRYRDLWPFALPATVSIETRTICNGRCAFCAVSVDNHAREDRAMPWAVFARLIEELTAVHYAGRVAFFVNNEPLLDKGLEEKIAYARERLPLAFFQVSTNGIILTPERANSLFDAGLDDLTVNDYLDNRPVRGNIEETFRSLSPERRRRFIVYLREREVQLFNRAGSAPNRGALDRPMRAFCQMPFSQINIVHDGTVSLCCQDVLVQVPIGNAYESGIWNVWFSERYREIRRRLMAKDRGCTELCRACDYRGFKALYGVWWPLNRLFRVLK
ncbi:MAG: radical SAM protein [Myxococcales bacterium]|nr:radical SAM protein [Myxococcales bacterium]